MALQLYHSVMKVVAPIYQRSVAKELNKMGKSSSNHRSSPVGHNVRKPLCVSCFVIVSSLSSSSFWCKIRYRKSLCTIFFGCEAVNMELNYKANVGCGRWKKHWQLWETAGLYGLKSLSIPCSSSRCPFCLENDTSYGGALLVA